MEFSGGLRQQSTMFNFRHAYGHMTWWGYNHTDEHGTILWMRLSSISAAFWSGNSLIQRKQWLAHIGGHSLVSAVATGTQSHVSMHGNQPSSVYETRRYSHVNSLGSLKFVIRCLQQIFSYLADGSIYYNTSIQLILIYSADSWWVTLSNCAG